MHRRLFSTIDSKPAEARTSKLRCKKSDPLLVLQIRGLAAATISPARRNVSVAWDKVSGLLSVCEREWEREEGALETQPRAQALKDETKAAFPTSTQAASDSAICLSEVCIAVFLLRKRAFKLLFASPHHAINFLASMSPLCT